MTFVCAKWLLAPSIQAKKEPFHSRPCDWEFHRSKPSAQEQVNRRQQHSKALLVNTASSTRKIFTACLLNSNFPLQLSPPSTRHTRSRVNHSATKMLGGEEQEEGTVSAGWAVPQYASRDTGSLALLLLAAVPFPHWLWLKPFSLDVLPSPWDLPLNYASFALPRVYLPKGSMWPMVCILV